MTTTNDANPKVNIDRIGVSLDDFLKEEGIFEDVREIALQRVEAVRAEHASLADTATHERRIGRKIKTGHRSFKAS